jgi:hypothetical protein
MIRVFLRTPNRLLKFYGMHVWWLGVFKTKTSTCGPYYLEGSAIERTIGLEIIFNAPDGTLR